MVFNSVIVDFGNRILNTLNDIKLPLLPEAILYIILVLFWLVLKSNLVNITDLIRLKFKYIIFIESTFLLSFLSSYV